MDTKFYDTAELGRRFKVHPHTIGDWIRTGCPTSNGRVKLQAVKLGRRWQVAEEWLAVFLLRARPFSGRPELELE